jgi:hypothetical protein
MTSKLEELQEKVNFWLHWLAIVVTSVVLVVVATLTYWMLEPDPLVVDKVGYSCSECSGRKFSFERYVKSNASLDIYVQQRWYNLDGIDDRKGIHKEIIITEQDYYPLGKDFEKDMEFTKCVPDNVPVGRYEYRPWATYKINPIKTVHRLLPVQEVNVVCDFDPSKHKSCDP